MFCFKVQKETSLQISRSFQFSLFALLNEAVYLGISLIRTALVLSALSRAIPVCRDHSVQHLSGTVSICPAVTHFGRHT